MDHGKSVVGGSGTSDEPCTKTEHWRTGASWTRISRPFPSSLVSRSLPLLFASTDSYLVVLYESTVLRESSTLFSSLSGVRCVLRCPVDRLLIAAKYSGDCPTYGDCFSMGRKRWRRQKWTRTEGNGDRYKEEETRSRNRAAVLCPLKRV